jgi:hypothetical protein
MPAENEQEPQQLRASSIDLVTVSGGEKRSSASESSPQGTVDVDLPSYSPDIDMTAFKAQHTLTHRM